MTDMNRAGIIVWSLIFVLFVIVICIIRWSFKINKKTFDKIVKSEVEKELNRRTAATQAKDPKPGSDAHYEAWREEQLKKNGKDD